MKMENVNMENGSVVKGNVEVLRDIVTISFQCKKVLADKLPKKGKSEFIRGVLEDYFDKK